MNKQCFLCLTLLVLMLMGCGEKEGECRIHGTLPNEKYDGKYMFLIAEDKNIRDSVGIDSVKVEGRQFELTTTKHMMGILRMDYHFRYGLQDLLVVAEPGDVYVTIDSVSSSYGTPNNDVLQQWKNVTELTSIRGGIILRNYQKSFSEGDSVKAKVLKARLDSLHDDYVATTRQMAEGLGDGPLKDFLNDRIPGK